MIFVYQTFPSHVRVLWAHFCLSLSLCFLPFYVQNGFWNFCIVPRNSSIFVYLFKVFCIQHCWSASIVQLICKQVFVTTAVILSSSIRCKNVLLLPNSPGWKYPLTQLAHKEDVSRADQKDAVWAAAEAWEHRTSLIELVLPWDGAQLQELCSEWQSGVYSSVAGR